MRTIWKYRLFVDDDLQKIWMPAGAIVRSVQVQGDEIALWAEVIADHPREERMFLVFGTGHEMPRDIFYAHTYIATVQQPPFVWHIYEVTAK